MFRPNALLVPVPNVLPPRRFAGGIVRRPGVVLGVGVVVVIVFAVAVE